MQERIFVLVAWFWSDMINKYLDADELPDSLRTGLGKGSKTPVTENFRKGGTPLPPSLKAAGQKVNGKS